MGSQLPSTGTQYLTLKEKGDKVTFRIAQEPVYEGKHFKHIGDKWEVTDCPRINGGNDCELCEMYFGIMNEARKIKDSNKEEYEKLKESARPFSVAIQFYWPVLSREEKKFRILRMTPGIRNEMNEHFENGVDIFKFDWVLRNTGSSATKNRYSLSRVDSADTAELDETEKVELEKAKAYDMSTLGEETHSFSQENDKEADETLVKDADKLAPKKAK